MLLCVIAGICCGIAAVLFDLSIKYLFDFVWEWARSFGPWFWVVMPIIPAIGGLFVGIVLNTVAPNASGSGIPQTKAVFYNDFGKIPLRDRGRAAHRNLEC